VTNKSIPIRIDCPCGSNLFSGKVVTDHRDLSSLGVLTLLMDNVNITCPDCAEYLDGAEDDFSRTVNDLGL
jgi:hypothetical protein